MKITNLQTFFVPRRSVFLKVETDEGICGWGEPTLEGWAETMQTAVKEISDYFIGKNPLQIEQHWQAIFRNGCYRGGPVLMSLIAGIDQALWDIKGKYYNAPIYELLGGATRDKIKTYRWISGNKPEDLAADALLARESGYTAIKMNVVDELHYIDSYKKIDAAIAKVAKIREKVSGDLEIGIDFHGRVHKAMAKILAKELEPYRPMFYEDPVLSEHKETLRDIVSHSNIPIALGERMYSRWDFKSVFSEGCADIINPDLSHAGGISECRKIITMAETYDIVAAPHCPLGPIALAACMQIDAVSNNVFIQEQSLSIHNVKGNVLLDTLVDVSVFQFEEGYLNILNGPGLGIEINEEVVVEKSKSPIKFRAPFWKNEDGTIAEW